MIPSMSAGSAPLSVLTDDREERNRWRHVALPYGTPADNVSDHPSPSDGTGRSSSCSGATAAPARTVSARRRVTRRPIRSTGPTSTGRFESDSETPGFDDNTSSPYPPPRGRAVLHVSFGAVAGDVRDRLPVRPHLPTRALTPRAVQAYLFLTGLVVDANPDTSHHHRPDRLLHRRPRAHGVTVPSGDGVPVGHWGRGPRGVAVGTAEHTRRSRSRLAPAGAPPLRSVPCGVAVTGPTTQQHRQQHWNCGSGSAPTSPAPTRTTRITPAQIAAATKPYLLRLQAHAAGSRCRVQCSADGGRTREHSTPVVVAVVYHNTHEYAFDPKWASIVWRLVDRHG